MYATEIKTFKDDIIDIFICNSVLGGIIDGYI
jgi:hypothetical protein